MKPLQSTSRIVVALASLALIPTLFLPIWKIDLWAPQYPEGLVMKIWLSKLTGDVDVINGLNHYIGMAHIREDMFPEFTYLPYIVVFFIVYGVLTALLKSRKLLIGYLSLLILSGIAALYDFWKWGYEYGHNLDPNAPIQVPGMSYQPPIIGYKALLNFGAYSIPDVGGWIFLLAGLLIAATTYYELYYLERTKQDFGKARNVSVSLFLLLSIGIFTACKPEPNAFQYGHDACHYCKMTIVDKKFASEIVTAKGKAFKFDDIVCLVRHIKEEEIAESELAYVLVNDYGNPDEMIDTRQATFVQSNDLRSPMMGNTAAFATKEAALKIQEQGAVQPVFGWVSLIKSVE